VTGRFLVAREALVKYHTDGSSELFAENLRLPSCSCEPIEQLSMASPSLVE
jgi:hypothetical protein